MSKLRPSSILFPSLVMTDAEVVAVLRGNKKVMRLPPRHQPLPSVSITGRPLWSAWVRRNTFTTNHRKVVEFMPATKEERIIREYFVPVLEWLMEFAPFKVGDVVRVRETWTGSQDTLRGYFKADYAYWDFLTNQRLKMPGEPEKCRWRSATTSPFWASRLFLKITSVRAERLQAITGEDAILDAARYVHEQGKGIRFAAIDAPPRESPSATTRWAFARYWNRKHPHLHWKSNPFVFRCEFEPVDRPPEIHERVTQLQTR